MRLARVVMVCSLVIACGYRVGVARAAKALSAVPAATPGWNAAALDELAAYVQSQKTTGFLGSC